MCKKEKIWPIIKKKREKLSHKLRKKKMIIESFLLY